MKYEHLDENKRWMITGKIGCTFAALFAKNPELVSWQTIVSPYRFSIPKDCCILSLQFPGRSKEWVLSWAMCNGFYLTGVSDALSPLVGLRYNVNGKVSWVQYFGPDSHVITRQAPIPELMLCVKLPVKSYHKVVKNTILHLAHASVSHLKEHIADKLWQTSYTNTEKRLGGRPGLPEAAKTTFVLNEEKSLGLKTLVKMFKPGMGVRVTNNPHEK